MSSLRKVSTVSLSPFQMGQSTDETAGQVEVRSRLSHILLCTNLDSRSGRRRVAQLILSISLIPMLAMIAQNCFTVVQSHQRLDKIRGIQNHVLLNIKVGTIVHYVQLERGTSALYIGSNWTVDKVPQVEWSRGRLEVAVRDIDAWVWTSQAGVHLEDSSGGSDTGVDFKTRESFMAGIRQFRSLFDSHNLTIDQVLDFYSGLNMRLMEWMAHGMLSADNGTLWAMLVAFHMLMLAKEQAG